MTFAALNLIVMRRILHAEDHPIIRSFIRARLEKFMGAIQYDEAGDGDEAFEKLTANDYDIVLLDISMPGREVLTLVHDILIIKPATKILIFSMFDEGLYAKTYLQAGVMGYIAKDAPIEELEKAINLILEGRKYISHTLRESLANDALENRTGNPFDLLSEREFQIVRYLLKGETVASISKELNLSPSTVGTFKSRIFEKLDCTNVIDITYLAKANNLI